MIRKRNSLKHFFLIWLTLMRSVLFADQLSDASEYEKEGKTAEAKETYIRWLEQDSNKRTLSYGRILLHVLRMGGEPNELLSLLDSYLPGVNNDGDRNEILKFGAYLADLTGYNQRARSYFSLLGQGDERFDWIMKYYNLQNGSGTVPEDPLMLSLGSEDSSFIKDQFLIYLIYLKGNINENNSLASWLERSENRYPFLKDSPEWLFAAWFGCTGKGDEEKADYYRTLLLDRFPETPEAGLLEGQVQLLYNPTFFKTSSDGERESPTLDDAEDAGTFFHLQAGAFGRINNALALQKEINERTGLDAEIIHSGNVYKVIIPTEKPEQDKRMLKRLGYETFMILQAVPNR